MGSLMNQGRLVEIWTVVSQQNPFAVPFHCLFDAVYADFRLDPVEPTLLSSANIQKTERVNRNSKSLNTQCLIPR